MNGIKTSNALFLLSGVVLLAVTGCIIDPRHVEEDFGKSVRQMVNAQIYDPVVATKPSEVGPELLDGPVTASSIDEYRKKAIKPKPNSNFTFTID